MSFFDNITEKAKQYANIAADKAKDVAEAAADKARDVKETAQLTMAIKSEQREMDKNYRAIGQWFVSEYQGEIPDAVKDVVAAIEASKAKVEEMEAALAETTELCQVQWAGRAGELQYVLVLCHRKAGEAARDALKSFGFTATSFRGWKGTARSNIDQIEDRQRILSQELEACRARLAQEAGHQTALQICIDHDAGYPTYGGERETALLYIHVFSGGLGSGGTAFRRRASALAVLRRLGGH